MTKGHPPQLVGIVVVVVVVGRCGVVWGTKVHPPQLVGIVVVVIVVVVDGLWGRIGGYLPPSTARR